MIRRLTAAKPSRRLVLAAGAIVPVTGSARAVPVAEEHRRIVPLPGVATTARDSEETLQKAFSARVARLEGLDPGAFVKTFDWGRESRLPDGRTLREWQVVSEERTIEVAPGIRYPAWTYNGTVPGPTLRCKEGERVRIHFENRSQSDHTMHFHGTHAAAVDGAMAGDYVRPGGSTVYEFDAEPAGLHLYHCHVMPLAMHMGRGLYGAFIVDPHEARPVDSECVFVSSGWDLDFDGRNEVYAVNGGANFYRDNPIRIRVGERVRFYYVNMLEYDPVHSIHLHANFFDCYRTTRTDEVPDRTDIVTLCQADRRVLEFSFKFPGTYMFHPHQSRFAECGCMGYVEVTA